jgi:hypothetical protein
MSALGHKRTCAVQLGMSAMGQQRTLASLFDHFVSAGDQCGRNLKAERLCGFEIDCKLVFCRGLHRQVGWLLALQNAIDVSSGAAILIEVVRPIADQAASTYKVAERVDRGQIVPRRKLSNQFGMVCTQSLAVTTSPPFGSRANAAMACSTSLASRISIALSSIPTGAPQPELRQTGRSRKLR